MSLIPCVLHSGITGTERIQPYWEPVYYSTAEFLKYEGKPKFLSESSRTGVP